jgi:hypothetical protein
LEETVSKVQLSFMMRHRILDFCRFADELTGFQYGPVESKESGKMVASSIIRTESGANAMVAIWHPMSVSESMAATSSEVKPMQRAVRNTATNTEVGGS